MQPSAPNIEELFFEARALRRPEDRSAFLDRACPDREARRRVEELLAVDTEANGFLASPASLPTVTDAQPPLPDIERPGEVIGPYRLLEAIGEGGMGTVYMAEQAEPVRRKVALKLIKPGMDSKQVVARFEAERQALALMDHPNIARVLDGGMTPSGLPYFVMELVRGLPITDYCDQHQLNIRERLELFVLVCRAVQHAHQKGVIHRDLKPSNVLVTVIDGEAVPKVIDFGIAKATGQALTEKTLFTGFHQFVGTPLYVSPEQAELSGVDVDTRSDIYSLGVLLYELLTGTTPFDAETLRQAAFDEMRRIICEEEPPRPSTRLSTLGERLPTVSARRKADPKRLGASVKGELDWVVMKALEKDRRRRYETANDFAADVMRYLTDRPVEAAPPSNWYRFAKFVHRNRTALTTASVVAVALVMGTTMSTWQAFRAREAGRRLGIAFQVANERHDLARQAVDEMYTEVAEVWLKDQAHATALQKRFLEKALAFYMHFAREVGNAPKDRFMAASAYSRVGSIQTFLGHPREAQYAFHRSIGICQSLAEAYPGRLDYRRTLADALESRGRLRQRLGDTQYAESDFRDALKVRETLAVGRPDDPELQLELAATCNGLGILLCEGRQYGESEELQRRASDVVAGVFNHEGVFDHLKFLARYQLDLGILLEQWGRLTEAEVVYSDTRALFGELVLRYPEDPAVQRDFASLWHRQGELLARTGRAREGESAFGESLRLWQELVRVFPGVPDYRHRMAHTHYSRALLRRDVGRSEEADSQDFSNSTYIWNKLVFQFPEVLAYREALADAEGDQARLHRQMGKTKEAEEGFLEVLTLREALAREFPTERQHREKLAGVLGDYGSLLREQGRADQAEQILQRSFSLRQESAENPPKSGENSPGTGSVPR